MILVMCGCIVGVWLRNCDILRDLYDYSTVIVAAGKIEAGFKPYTGVRTAMQSSTYLLNYWTEQVFGRNYLALTWGGLIQALGGTLLLRWVLRRRLESGLATVLALAVGLAGLSQHVVFFYNPIGILCFSLVLWGVAVEPEIGSTWSRQSMVVGLALFLGGINKLNFQGATLVLAGLLTLGALAGGRITGRACFRNMVLLIGAGLVLPLVFELAWTGATFAQWWADVVMLPHARQQNLTQIFNPATYLRPLYSSHHHLLLQRMGGLGVVFLSITAVWLWHEARAGRRPAADWIVRGLLILVGGLMARLLMVTNHETIVLTSLAYLVVGAAIYLQYRPEDPVRRRWMGRMITVAGLVWCVNGGYAAWHGSRVLYAPDPPPRSRYVRMDSTTPALAYFKGVRMLPDQIDALERVAAKLRTLEDPHGRLPGVLFGPALEWLERAYPEAIVRRAPIWYDAGTSLNESDDGYFRNLLDGGRRRLITHQGWQAWPPAIWQMLGREYRADMIGSRDVMYHPRGSGTPPVAEGRSGAVAADAYRHAAGGNVLLSATRYSVNLNLRTGVGRGLFGAGDNSTWFWPSGAREAQGQAVAQLASGVDAGVVTFRVIAGESVEGELLWETTAILGPDRREMIIPVSLHPGGRPLWFQTEVSGAAGDLVAGWREFRITHAGNIDHPPALPFGQGLRLISSPLADEIPDANLWYGRRPQALLPNGWALVPTENWRLQTPGSHHVRVDVRLAANASNPADPVIVTLAWYRAGRFEIMTEQMIDLRKTQRVTLEANIPEPEGWVGLLTRPAGGVGAGHRARIVSWETR